MAADTKYVVLREKSTELDEERTWEQVATIESATARGAVLLAAKVMDLPDAGVTFVAVPERSWKPVTVKATQTITLKVDESE